MILRNFKLLCWLLLTGASGCGFHLNVNGSAHINPRPTADYGIIDDSFMDFSVYQLRQHARLSQVSGIPWELFRYDGLPTELRPFLAVPADVPRSFRPREDFVIGPKQHMRIQLDLAKRVSALLVVARGRYQGVFSVRLLYLNSFEREVSLCFDMYQIFTDPRSWPCNQGDSNAGK